MRYHVIINPAAGKQDISKQLIPDLFQSAANCGIREEQLQISLTASPSHAHILASEAAKQAAAQNEPIRIYAAGGDGTFNEVITGASPYPNAAVGLLPYGSGNDFLRSFGTREEFCSLERQFRGTVKPIDLIRTHNGYAANICSAGLDAKVAYQIPQFRRIPFCGGSLAYKLSIVKTLLGKRSSALHIQIDDKEFERECLMTAVCNGHAYGGGFLAAPESALDDGVLDVLVVKSIPLGTIAKVLPTYQSGRHFANGQIVPELADIIEYFPAKKVHIRPIDPKQPMIINIDGECRPDQQLTAEVVPLAARIILPASES